MPRVHNSAKARQAAFDALLQASSAVAVRYRTDQAQRGEATPEYFEHPALGRSENCVMFSVVLLNRLAAAMSLFGRVMAEPAKKPRRTGPMHVLLDESGQDC